MEREIIDLAEWRELAMGQTGFWDVQAREAKLAQKENILIRLDEIMRWETSERSLSRSAPNRVKAMPDENPTMSPPVQNAEFCSSSTTSAMNSLEYQVNDRISFMRFLYLGIEDAIPDATTVWLFREQLSAGRSHG